MNLMSTTDSSVITEQEAQNTQIDNKIQDQPKIETKPQPKPKQNNPQSEGADDLSSSTPFLTKDLFINLPHDNMAMYTNENAVKCFWSQLSQSNIERMMNYIMDSQQTIGGTKTLRVFDTLTLGTNYPMKSSSTANVNTDSGVSTVATVSDSNLRTKFSRLTYVDGGYKIIQTSEGMDGLIKKRLQNDLGQQTQGANYVFRQNDYVTMDVAASLACDNQTRACKTMEAFLDAWYEYKSPEVPINNPTVGNVFIIDNSDYNFSPLQELLDNADNEKIFVINETKPIDAVAQTARLLSSYGFLSNLGTEPVYIVFSNAQNPLVCERCVVHVNSVSVNKNPTKLMFGSPNYILAQCARYIGLSNSNGSLSSTGINTIVDIELNGTIINRGLHHSAANEGFAYDDYATYASHTWGTATAYTNVVKGIPHSNIKWNNKDLFNAFCLMTEFSYDINTPFAVCDYSLIRVGSGHYGILTIPICDYALRIALDKDIIRPLVNKTHRFVHRAVLAQKVRIFADYKAGRLLSSITETYGSLTVLRYMTVPELADGVTKLLDASNVTYYDGETLIGLLAHYKFRWDDADNVANYSGTSNVGWFTSHTHTTGSYVVEEYYPISIYWRYDAFGAPEFDDMAMKNRGYITGNAGYIPPDHDRYACISGNTVGYITYEFNGAGIQQQTITFTSRGSLANVKSASGVYQSPNIFFSKDCVFGCKIRPLCYSTSAHQYPIGMHNDPISYQILSSSSIDDVLFG